MKTKLYTMHYTLYTTLAFFFLLSVSGCANLTQKNSLNKNSGILETAAMLKFADVPVPTGFKILPQNSYSFESAGVRVGVLRYLGKANPDQVVNFYKDQMPMYNWTLLNIIEYGDRLLNFERENETCIVSLQIKGSEVTISISLGPKSQIVPKRAKQPVQ